MNREASEVWRQILEEHERELGECKHWALNDEDGTEVANLYRELKSPEALQRGAEDDDNLALICRLAIVGLGAAVNAASDARDVG